MSLSYPRILSFVTALFTGIALVQVSATPSIAMPATQADPRSVMAALGEDPAIAAYVAQYGSTTLTNQRDLMDFKGWIVTNPLTATSGYMESVNDAARRGTTLLWHGDTRFQAEILAEGKRRGISVSIETRRYGVDELKAAMARVMDNPERLASQGFRPTGVAGITAGHDGIVVHGNYTAVSAFAAGASAPSAAEAVRAAASAVELAAGVPVKMAASDGFTPYVATRSNDNPAYNAGGYLRRASNVYENCSSGFGIWINGTSRTTTARHCNAEDWTARDNVNKRYGGTYRLSGDGGARVLTGNGYYWMFDGAWNDATGYKKTVSDFGHVGINDTVCTSGGNSGVHCGIQVNEMLYPINDGYGTFYTITARQTNSGQIAAAPGDSGGPVFTLAGTGRVYAVGMIQGGDDEIHCPPLHDAETFCGRVLRFTSMWTIVTTISGASLRTG